ncbi:MAG: Mur ligase family protein [Saprospiraceae bacterium]
MDALTLTKILGTDTSLLYDGNFEVSYLSFDTRKIIHPKETLFIAIEGSIQDGHSFIMEAIDAGVRNIVVNKFIGFLTAEVNVFKVDDTLGAFQKISAFHRSLFSELEVIGITGSNGKTIVKEWLAQLLNDKKVVKSPGSYNSQTGVPLSVWQISKGDQIAIFEAGISQPGEMTRLQYVINPTLGIFTNIGDAHDAGFADRTQKLDEKLNLFVNCRTVVYCADDKMVHTKMRERCHNASFASWGFDDDATLIKILSVKSAQDSSQIKCLYQGKEYALSLPFTDRASLENAMHCVATMWILEYSFETIQKRILELEHIPMRLEMKQGIKNSILINDTYNADLQSFKIGLEFLSQQSVDRERMVILSEFQQLSTSKEGFIKEISSLLHKYNVEHVITIGEHLKPLERYLNPFVLFTNYPKTDSLLQNLHKLPIEDKAIMIKGARVFALDRISQILSDKGHTAVLETDLLAVEHNLTYFSSLLEKMSKLLL